MATRTNARTPAEQTAQPMQAVWNGAVLAESDRTIVVEGNHYFPPDSIRWEHFRDNDRQTTCPWKGVASYYDVVVDGERRSAAGWTYHDPSPAAQPIADHVAFWRGVEVIAASESVGREPRELPHGRWRVSAERSSVGFRVKKMGLYKVKGRFRDVDGLVELGGERAHAEVTIDARSITTRMPPRDWHLRTRDFLHSDEHPAIHVTAPSVESTPDGRLRVPATFAIRGTRADVELFGHHHGGGDGEPLVLHLHGSLDRHDFGIRPRQPFDMVVGRKVELAVELVLEPAR